MLVAERFGGRLSDVTITRVLATGPNPADPAGPPLSTTATYVGDGIAFGYGSRKIDGEQVLLADYKVVVLLGTLRAVADDAAAASLDLPGVALDTIVEARVEGAAGNAITVELVGDAGAAAGTLIEIGTNVRLGYLPSSTTIAQLEALFSSSTLARVSTPGTGATVLGAGAAFAATPLAGGTDATVAITGDGFVPRSDDRISGPAPGQVVSRSGRIADVRPVTHAAATCHVIGEGV